MPGRAAVLIVTSLLLGGCAVPVAAGLDDSEANRVAVALDRASLEPEKEADPASDGKWRVTVGRDDVARALAVLAGEGLPRHEAPGLLDTMGRSLVPSETAEQAQLALATGAELQRSLEGIDGVLSARVHLGIPAADPLRDTPPPRSSASVLIEYRGATPPLTAESVQRLVAGAQAGLAPAEVAVVMVPRSAPPGAEGTLAHVGPIAVAQSSLRGLKVALTGLIGLVAALSAATLLLYSRLNRVRAAPSGS